jgi:hypothetical protein
MIQRTLVRPWWPLTVMTSMVPTVSNGSALTTKPKRMRSGTWFRAWSFQVTLKADLSQGASTQDKARLLKEHLSNRTAHSIKTSFTSVSTFCYESQLSGQSNSNGLVSILRNAIGGMPSESALRAAFIGGMPSE